jgi:hypothetical protein
MPLKAKLSVLCVAAVLVLGLSGPGEAAVRKPIASQITLTVLGPDGATGTVSSGQAACRGDRVVTLYRENSGSSIPSSVPVANVWTRADGTWSFDGWLYPAQYWAAVQPKQAKRFNPTKRFSCQYAASNERFF